MRLTGASRRIVPLIAALLVLHGFFGSTLLRKLGLVPTGLGFGLAEAVLGAGLILGYGWARWLTLGACFLAVIAAFVTPILLFLFFASPQSEAIEFWRNVTSGAAIVFGVIGWFGLTYLRSERGRRDFSGDLGGNVALKPEPSWVALPPAALCLVLLLGTYDAGLRIARFIADNGSPTPPAVPAAGTMAPAVPFRPDEPVEYPDPDPVPRPKPVAALPREEPVHYGTMDIALTDICFAGHKVRVKYTNLGTVPIPGAQFGMQVYVDRAMVHLTKDFRLDAPPTGVSRWTPEFDITSVGYAEGDDFYVVAQTYSRNVGQTNWDNDRLIRNSFFESDRHPCPDVSTGS